MKLLESQSVKEAFELKLSPQMIGYLRDIDEGVKYANELADKAAEIRVTNESTNSLASEMIVNMSKAKKALEELRKVFSTPLFERKKLVDDAFKRWLGLMSRQEDRLRQETGDWYMAQKREAEERQRKIDQENQKAAAKARATGRAVPVPIQAAVAEPEATTRTAVGTLNVRTKFVGELVDIELVPRNYLMLNDRAVSTAINDSGVKHIPGIKIKEVPVTTAR